MFYRRELKLPSSKSATVEFASFKGGLNRKIDSNILPISYAVNTYNFFTKDGALKDGLGIDAISRKSFGAEGEIEFGDGAIKKTWQYTRYDFDKGERADKLIAYKDDGYLYEMDINGGSSLQKIEGSYFLAEPHFINYRLNGEDVLIVSSPQDEMLVWNGTDAPYRVPDAPKITSTTIHYERLFATSAGEQNAVWFSETLNPLNWDINLEGAGFIEMTDERGSLIKVVSFLDYLYVFREFGISRLTAYADQTQFSVSHLFTSSGRISGETIAICGDRILFLASSGLYAFDGLSTHRLLGEITDDISNIELAKGCYYNGKYYLACRYNYNDGQKVLCENGDYRLNTVIEYDLQTKDFHILRGVDITSFSVVKIGNQELLTATLRGEYNNLIATIEPSGSYFGQPLEKVWQSPFSDLGRSDYVKTLKSVHMFTATDCLLEINADGNIYKLTISGGTTVQRINPNISFERISLKFICRKTGAYITRPILRLSLSGGR